MRSESDQRLIDRVRSECERLFDGSASATEFLPSLLEISAQDSRVFAAAMWLVDDRGQVRLAADHRLTEFLGGAELRIDVDHQQLLQQTLADGRSRVASDRRVPDAGMPPHSIVIAGMRLPQRSLGVVELYAEESPGERSLQHLRLLAETLAGYASQFFSKAAAPASDASADGDFFARFERLTLELHRSLDIRELAVIAVNDVRQLLGCDRVSLVVRHGPRTVVRAISGQDEVQSRANQVQALARLSDRVMAAGEPLTYRGTLDGLPPPLEQPLADYLSESRMRMVRLIPLREPRRPPIGQLMEDPAATAPRRVIGCLVVEQANESRPRAGLVERADLAAEHVAAALMNARRREEVFLLPLWTRLGRVAGWFRGRRLWTAVAVLAGLAIAGIVLALVPWEYRVEATGQALPVVRHGVFAPFDATVAEVLAESNQRVAKGAPLLRLESPSLEEQSTRLKGEIARLEAEAYKLRRDQDEARRAGDREAERQSYTQYRQTQTELEARRQEYEIVAGEMAKLSVAAPADGVVATFQLEQLLRNRPVQRGDLLLEVMDDRGAWRLELEVPENRMGHLLAALASSDGSLVVDYTPATDARLELRAVLNEVATRSNESEEQGTIVQAFAAINPDDMPGRRIGAEVDARIRCGSKSLFYCLFGDVVEFVQRKLWW